MGLRLLALIGHVAAFAVNEGPWWRLEYNERGAELFWRYEPGFCSKAILDISKLPAAEETCVVKCKTAECEGVADAPCFCDAYLEEFDTPEGVGASTICGDVDVCKELCVGTAGCFGFAMQNRDPDLSRNRCVLYRDDCILDLEYGTLVSDPLYNFFYKGEKALEECSLGIGLNVKVEKDDHHHLTGIYVGDEHTGWNTFHKLVAPDYVGPEIRVAWDHCGRGWTIDWAPAPDVTCADVEGWTDPLGSSCHDYAIGGYYYGVKLGGGSFCNGEQGEYGPGWCTGFGDPQPGCQDAFGPMDQYVGADGYTAWDNCCACGGGVKTKFDGHRQLSEGCEDDPAAAARALGLPEDEAAKDLCTPATWEPRYCGVPEFARACPRSCRACGAPAAESVGDVAAVRRALRATTRAPRRLGAEGALIPVYSTFGPDTPCPHELSHPNGTNDTSVLMPEADHMSLVVGIDGMFDLWAQYQPIHGVQSAWTCPAPDMYSPFFHKYCPHNNLVVEAESCAAKCSGTADLPGAAGTPGFCAGNAGLVETNNALCLDYAGCKALCDAMDDCTGFDTHKTLPRCWLNGPHCAPSSPVGGTHIYEDHPELTKWAKKPSSDGIFTYQQGECHGFDFPPLSTLHHITARPRSCEQYCRYLNKNGAHCGGFVLVPDPVREVQECYFFVSRACTRNNVTFEYEWVVDEGEEEGSPAWDAYYYFDVNASWVRVDDLADVYYYSSDDGSRMLLDHVEDWGAEGADTYFKPDGYYYFAYYYAGTSEPLTSYETCAAVCETILPGTSFVATYHPPQPCYVNVHDPTDHVSGKYVATSSKLYTFDSDDHAERLQWKGGFQSNCNGWVVSKNNVEAHSKYVYTCGDLPDEFVRSLVGSQSGFTSCFAAHGTPACGTDAAPTLLRGLCRHSCHDSSALPQHSVYDINLHANVHYSHDYACHDEAFSTELGGAYQDLEFTSCADLVAQAPGSCGTDALVQHMCAETCEENGYPVGTYVTYREHLHQDYTDVYQSWPRGAEEGFTEEQAAVLLEPEYVHHVGLVPCETDARMVNSTDRLNELAGDYWPVETPEAPVHMEYVCGTPPSCPALTSCVMSSTEFAAEYGRFRHSAVLETRISDLPVDDRMHLLYSPVWADQLNVLDDQGKNFGFGKVLITQAQAVLVHRTTDILFGKEVFRSAPLHSRFRFYRLPAATHTVVLTLSSPEPQDLLRTLGRAFMPKKGYLGFTGDAFRLELFDEFGRVVEDGDVHLEIMSPGTMSEFGLKVLTDSEEHDGTMVDVVHHGASVERLADPGWFRLALPAHLAGRGDFVLTEDLNECLGENTCEGPGDGGRCSNTDGGYECGCAENFRLMLKGPAAGQCVQDKWTYMHSEQSQTILAYPQDVLQFGWRVNEVRVFEKYDTKTRTCIGRCPDGSESSNCHYGVSIDDEGGMGAVAPPPPNLGTLCTAANCPFAAAETCAGCVMACSASDACAMNPDMANCALYAACAVLGDARRLQGSGNLAQMGMVSNVRASDPYPGHYKDALTDGDPKSAWWSRDLVVDRAKGSGAWVAFDVQRDPQCVRLEMPACAGHMPEVMVIHKGSGEITEVSPSFSSDASPFPRPGWTESRLHAVKPGVTSVDLGIDCGFTGAQFFGELLTEYTGVPSACQCKQLCLDHLDEGCETWKWFSETAHCYLQQDVFVGPADSTDTLKSKRATVRTEGLYLESGGWWRRSFSDNWPGWHTGDTGAVITEVITDQPGGGFNAGEPFSLTVKGLGFPSDAKALDRQRVKIVPEGTSCARGMPPDEVSGVRCTNWFTCAPKPVKSSRKSATWEGITIAESKEFVAYKVCWCAGECWEGQNWLEAPRRLMTMEAGYVWGTPGFDKDAVTRKDTPLKIKVTRRPFATTTHTDDWGLKLVRSVFGCELLGDGMLCNGDGDCGHGMAEGPDEMSWDVAISDRILAGDYKVCFSDNHGESWYQISSERGLLLTVEQLAEDSQHPRGLFHEQRVSVRKADAAKVELKGYSMVEPFPGKLGVSPQHLGCSTPVIEAVLHPQIEVSGKDSAVFMGDFGNVTPGTYSLCYCNEDAYDVNEYHSFVGAPLAVGDLPGVLHEDLCAAKCSKGCVGPSCFCDGYDPATDDAASSALCLSSIGCRAACDSLGSSCMGYMMARTTNRCMLYGTTAIDESDDFHTWTKSAFWPDLACNTTASFAAADAAELFAKSIGFVTVSERLHVGADFVVTPEEPASLELAGMGLTPKDQVIVIECSDQCGIADPTPAVSMKTTRPVDAKFDAPSVMHGPAPVFQTELAQPNFMRDELQYCPGGNIPVVDSFPLMQEHQCYRKCEQTAPCVGPDCFCDGFFEGHDGPESTALCLPLEQCKSLCALAWPFCYSIDMHREKNRCFLNGPVCSQTAPLTDPNYDQYINSAWSAAAVEGALDGTGGEQTVTALPANEDFGADGATRRLTAAMRKLGESVTAEEVRKLLAPPDYGLSWGDLLRYDGVTFHQAGTYKVCACDSAVTGGCNSPADFAVEVGKAHASGLQCLLSQPQFTRGECIAQKYGGLRCYEDGAPAVNLPWDELGVPEDLGPGAPVLFGAGPGTTVFGEDGIVEKVRAFCLYGTADNSQYDFCSSFRL